MTSPEVAQMVEALGTAARDLAMDIADKFLAMHKMSDAELERADWPVELLEEYDAVGDKLEALWLAVG